MSPKDFFYGQAEPVWIAKAEKKDDGEKGGDDKDASSSKKGSEKLQYPIWPIHTAAPYPPYQLNYNPEYIPTPAAKDGDAKEKAASDGKDTKVVMWVPMCCSACEDLVRVAINGLHGVKSVECNSYKKKVTVVATSAAAADILIECRRLFKKSRMWSDDD